ncbi:MAG: metallophosphoesterase, partial [bacterium]
MTLAAVRFALALAVFAAPAPAPDLVIDTGPGPRPWTHLNLANDPKAFQFAIVTDRTGGHREGIFESAVGKLNLLRPEFVMSVGDLVEGYTEDPAEITAQRDEFDGFVRRLAAPFFYVPGNHDVTNPVMLASWKERYGRDYHSFVYRGVLFVGLNSDDPYPAKIGAAQLAWLEKTLAGNRDARWTLVFLHRPLWDGDKNSGWDKVEQLLAGRKYTVFAGHQHNYWKTVRQDMRYITLATTGGGSQLRGLAFGEFDHVAWVTMSDQGPIVANLLLGGILDEDIVTEQTREIPEKVAAVAPRQAVPVFAGAAPR